MEDLLRAETLFSLTKGIFNVPVMVGRFSELAPPSLIDSLVLLILIAFAFLSVSVEPGSTSLFVSNISDFAVDVRTMTSALLPLDKTFVL